MNDPEFESEEQWQKLQKEIYEAIVSGNMTDEDFEDLGRILNRIPAYRDPEQYF